MIFSTVPGGVVFGFSVMIPLGRTCTASDKKNFIISVRSKSVQKRSIRPFVNPFIHNVGGYFRRWLLALPPQRPFNLGKLSTGPGGISASC